MKDQDQTGPEGSSKLYEEVVQMPMVPIPATFPSLSQPTPVTSGDVPYYQLTEGKKHGSSLQMTVHNMHTLSQSGWL